jgi:predicted dienelactone hydrolase
MGRLPLVVIGHGNGHNFQWYDHIGNHLASYGYVVVSVANNTGPGPDSAATTELGHIDAFLDQAEAGAIASGALVGHIDSIASC